MIRLPPMSPNLNAYAERFVRSIKDECLDRMIFVGQGSLRRAVSEYMSTITGTQSPRAWKSTSRSAQEGDCGHPVRCVNVLALVAC